MARGEVIRVRDEFYIRSSSPRVDVRTRVLKQGDTFAVFDRFGDVETFGSRRARIVLPGHAIFIPADFEARKGSAFAAKLDGARRQCRSGRGRDEPRCLA